MLPAFYCKCGNGGPCRPAARRLPRRAGPAEPGRPLPPEAQEELRLRIDCRAAELFGLSPEELALILYAFPSLDNPRRGLPATGNMAG